MDERDWLIISTLYKFKNITKTANALYISQPALTARIKQIENVLGVELLYRSNKGVTFTPHGEYAAKFAGKILGDITNFKEKLTDLGEEVVGILKIASPSIIGRYYLPSLLEGFQKVYPKVKFEIIIRPSSEVIKLVKSRMVDFGLAKYSKGFTDEESLHLMDYQVMVANAEPFTLADLPNMKQVEYPYEEHYYGQIQKWWQDNFSKPPRIGSHVTNLDLCKEMVFNGLGYGILPEILIRECPYPLHTEALTYNDGSSFVRDTWLVYKKDNLETPLNKLFFNFIKKSDFNTFLRSRNK